MVFHWLCYDETIVIYLNQDSLPINRIKFATTDCKIDKTTQANLHSTEKHPRRKSMYRSCLNERNENVGAQSERK